MLHGQRKQNENDACFFSKRCSSLKAGKFEYFFFLQKRWLMAYLVQNGERIRRCPSTHEIKKKKVQAENNGNDRERFGSQTKQFRGHSIIRSGR